MATAMPDLADPNPCPAVRGRLAPSPTGYLHLGNAWSFLLAWLACRSAGGTLVLRMEDLDPERSRPAFAAAIMEDLRWLGLDWDEGPDKEKARSMESYFQSARHTFYQGALRRLEEDGAVYPCYCTRKELRSLAGAPHPTRESPFGDSGAAYPGTCRFLSGEERRMREQEGRRACLRLRCPEHSVAFQDAVYGPHSFSPAQWGGDFALQRSDGVIAYQLAVVVDDGLMGISQVVRGADLLSSTPRQLLLFDLLGFPRPSYAHIPLICDAEGFRLAKRHASLSLRSLREQGVPPENILGFLAWKAGLRERPETARPQELAHDLAGRRTAWGADADQIFPPKLGASARLLLGPDPLAELCAVTAR